MEPLEIVDLPWLYEGIEIIIEISNAGRQQRDVQRQIVISALSSLPEDYVLFISHVDAQQVRSLLRTGVGHSCA
jgi:hypothetical protein